MNRTFTIGTRGSDLALWQANYVKDRLAEINVMAERAGDIKASYASIKKAEKMLGFKANMKLREGLQHLFEPS